MTIDSDAARFTRILRAAILWPVGIIFVVAILLLLFTFELFSIIKWSGHSYQVLAETRKCEGLLLGTQNDVRGYLLTGDSTFLKDNSDKRAAADAELATLKRLVSDNPQQSIRVQDISQAKDIWYAHADTMIANRTKQVSTNADWVRTGRTVMENLEAGFNRFIAAEIALRDFREGKVADMKRLLIYSGVVLAVLLALSIGHVVRRQMMELAANYRASLETSDQRLAELTRSEKDLESQKEWLRVTLTSIGDGVMVTDPQGRIVLMNHEAEKLSGWTQSDALHQPLPGVFRIVNEDTRATVADPVAAVLQTKKVVGLANHTVLLSRNGEEWPIEDTAAPIFDPAGNILGVVLVFHDASGIRSAQKSLKAYSVELENKVADRTMKLQQTVSELESFSYSVSHDLRSPLRAMLGFSEAILEDYGDKLDAQGKNYLERIKNSALRLDRLIQDLLSYTRISRQDEPLEVIDLHQFVTEIIEHDASLNQPTVSIHIDGTLPKVMGHTTALNQVVTNLLGNAAKFMAPGKKPEIRIRAENHGNMERIWVEDNGIGISAANQEKIFEMFMQINEPARYGGTGIGLAIVKKAMQTMRGTVGVESSEGEGSRFWIDLNKVA